MSKRGGPGGGGKGRGQGRAGRANKPRPSRGAPDGKPFPGGGRPPGKPRPAQSRPRPERREVVEAPHDTTLYGRNPVHEALRAGRRHVKRIYATQHAAHEPWLEGVPITEADADWIALRTGSEAHQGIYAEVEPYPYADAADLLAVEDPLIVALDEVQDPQNLGAIARTAEAAGATGLVIPERRSAEVTAAAAKASAGAVEHLPIARVRNLADFLAEAKEAGAWVYGAEGSAGSVPYDEPAYEGGAVLVLGAEGKGLRPRVRAACDVLVALPMHGRMGSLNVSAAAAVLLYEMVRRRAGSPTS